MISIKENRDEALVCECCRAARVVYHDGELGDVCDECFGHALRATRALRKAGLSSPGRRDRTSGGLGQ